MDFSQIIREQIREIVREELAKITAPASTPNMITVAAAAERASVNERTIRRWIRAGRLTAYKAGRVLRIDPDELEALLRRDGQVPGAPSKNLRSGNRSGKAPSPEAIADLVFGS